MVKRRNMFLGLIMIGIVLTLLSNFVVLASANTSEELPVPISFGDESVPIGKNCILLESVAFNLSDANPTQVYLISEGYEDLIFLFKGVSAPVNFSLKAQNEDSHHAGFGGDTCKVNIKTNPLSKYEFELSRGFDINFEASTQEKVDYSSGFLEIYQVVD